MNKHLATIILIGRPNVGKSTLFNRLIGKRQAIEHQVANTTRDVLRGLAWFGDRAIELIDTAGDAKAIDQITAEAKLKREHWLNEADHILFVFDVQEGLTAEDQRILRQVRKQGKPFSIVGTKEEGKAAQHHFKEDNFGAPFFGVSAIHQNGIPELLQSLSTYARPFKEEVMGDLVLIGRPNAGKSTLFNTLVGEAVSIVSTIPGTTRDVVSYLVPWPVGKKETLMRLHDTAGLAKRSRAMRGMQRFATYRIEDVLKLADCAVLCIDGSQDVAVQDAKVAEMVISAGLSLIIAVTKWDITERQFADQDEWLAALQKRFRFAPWLPVIFVSAQTRQNIKELRLLVSSGIQARNLRLSDEDLLAFLTSIHKIDERLQVISEIKQVATQPPKFAFTYREELHESLIRQVINRLRDTFTIGATPIQWEPGDRPSRRRSRR